MKFGKKIYTYQDIEEAKALIGKKVIMSDKLKTLAEKPETYQIHFLKQVGAGSYPFESTIDCTYQFIREVIEEEPRYRPYTYKEALSLIGKTVMLKPQFLRSGLKNSTRLITSVIEEVDGV